MPVGQFPVILPGQVLTAALLESMLPINAWKTSSTSTPAGGSTTLVADPDLQLPVAANAEYAVDAYVPYTCAGISSADNCGIAWEFTGPSGATLLLSGVYYAITGSSGSYAVALTLAGNTGLAATRTSGTPGGSPSAAGPAVSLILSGTLTTGGTAGTFGLSWAQSFLDGTIPTTVQAGARMSLRRMQ